MANQDAEVSLSTSAVLDVNNNKIAIFRFDVDDFKILQEVTCDIASMNGLVQSDNYMPTGIFFSGVDCFKIRKIMYKREDGLNRIQGKYRLEKKRTRLWKNVRVPP